MPVGANRQGLLPVPPTKSSWRLPAHPGFGREGKKDKTCDPCGGGEEQKRDRIAELVSHLAASGLIDALKP